MSINAEQGRSAIRDQSSGRSLSSICDGERESRQWTLKGLAPETVEVTREAARRSGMKLNSFVSLALEKAAADVSNAEIIASSHEPRSDDLETIKSELARIRAQGEHLESTINSISSLLIKLWAEKA